MEVNDDLAHDDFLVLNAVTSSVRANRLQQHREYVIDNWRKKEILNMKKVIASLSVKRDNLKKKRKKLTDYSKTYDKDFENLLKVDVPISQTTLSVKYKVLSKKKALEKFKKECEENLTRHTECWNKAKLQWEEIPEVKKINELRKKLESLREDKNKIKNAQNNKTEKMLQIKKRFENSVIKFAEGISIYYKTQEIIAQNRLLQKQVLDYEKNAKTLRVQIDRQIELRVEKELEQQNLQNFIGLDFEDFDTSLNIASAANISIQDISMNENEFDADCTNLSLDMTTDHPLSLTFGTDRNLGTPIAMSTPLCAELANHAGEHQTTSTSSIPSPSKPENQLTSNALTENSLLVGKPTPRLTNSQEPAPNAILADKLNQFNYTNYQNLQNQGVEEPTVLSPTTGSNEGVDTVRNEQITNRIYKDSDQQLASFDNTNNDKDVDYNEKYARSPDDQSILCEEPNSPPVRLTMPTFNSYKPPQAGPSLMSFFDFGSKQQKTDAASILDMF